MANLTFADLENEVFAHANLDGTDNPTKTNVDRWLNYVQQDICARWPWTFMESRESLIMIPDQITGTCSIANGSTAVTGLGTSWQTFNQGGIFFIQFVNSNDWYKVQTFVSPTTLTLEIAFQGATITNGTYTLRKFFYTLSTNIDRIIDIRNQATPLKLIQVDARTLDDLRPNPQSTNASYGYLTWGVDSNGLIQVTPYPFPSDNRVFEIRTTKRPVDGSISIPNKYGHVISWGALAIAFAYKKNLEMAAGWDAKFNNRIKEMIREYRMSEDQQIIMRSIDSVQRAKWIQMPEQYPVVTSG